MDTPKAHSIWRDADFVRLWSAGTISIFGSLVGRTAVPFVAILVLGAGPAEVAGLRSLELAAALVVGLLAGAWVDRLRRRPVMIAADLGRAVLLGSIPVAAVLGVLSLAQLGVVILCWAMLTTVFDLADRAFLPTLVGGDRLVEANSALTAGSAAAEFSGFGISGFLVQLLGAPMTVAVDAASFVASAVLVGFIRRPEPPAPPPAERAAVLREVREGLDIVARSAVLRALAAATALTHLTYGVFGAIWILYVNKELGLSPAAIGLIAAVGGLSSLGGALLVGPVARRAGVGRTLVIGAAGFLLGQLALPLAPSGAPLVAGAWLVLAQLVGDGAATAYEILDMSTRQGCVDDRRLGRVNGTIGTTATLLELAGTVVAGLVGEALGLRPAVWLGLTGAALALLVVWFSPLRAMREPPARPLGPAVVGEEMPITE